MSYQPAVLDPLPDIRQSAADGTGSRHACSPSGIPTEQHPDVSAHTVGDQSRPAERPTLRYGLVRVLARPALAWQVLNAQVRLWRKAQVPRSVRLVGRVRAGGGGRIVLGERVRLTGTTVPIELFAWRGGSVVIGAGTFINYGVSIAAHDSVTIGRDCSIGQYAIINDNDYHDIHDKTKLPPSRPVVLEDRVWLGARVIVLKGVRIGHDTVIGAGSVVTRDIPPRCVAAGMPAQVIRQF